MSNLNKIIKTAKHFQEIHSEEVSSVGFQTIVEMLKKMEISSPYSLSSLKKQCKEVIKKHGFSDNVDYISLTIESSSFGNRYSLSVSGISTYLRDCNSPKTLLKKLDDELKENQEKILEEISKKKEESNIDLK